MYYTNNPVADAERYMAEQERELQKLPKCNHCREHIQDETCWVINGKIYHPDCAEELFCKWTEDYMSQ